MAADAVTVYVTPAVKLVNSKDGVAAFTVTFVRILLEALLLSPPPRTTNCWNKILFCNQKTFFVPCLCKQLNTYKIVACDDY